MAQEMTVYGSRNAMLEERYARAFAPLESQLLTLLKPMGIRPEEFVQGTVFAMAGASDSLLACDMDTQIRGLMSLAVLGLMPDGYSGQGWLLPFKRKAQPVVGVQGFVTLAARAGFTLVRNVVREGDEFDFDEGTGFIHFKPKLRRGRIDENGKVVGEDDGADGKPPPIIAAWAKVTSLSHPPACKVVDQRTLLETMRNSPAVKAGFSSPWTDQGGRFYPQMCAKTAARMLRQSIPRETPGMARFHLAAQLDERHELLGKTAFIDPSGELVDDDRELAPDPIEAKVLTERPQYRIELLGKGAFPYSGPDAFRAKWDKILEAVGDKPEAARTYAQINDQYLREAGQDGEIVRRQLQAIIGAEPPTVEAEIVE